MKQKVPFLKRSFVLLLTLATLSLNITSPPAQAQPSDQEDAQYRNITIFIIDAFEKDIANVAEIDAEDQNCIAVPDGQDGAVIGGTPPIYTSGLTPFAHTHGEYVRRLYQEELIDRDFERRSLDQTLLQGILSNPVFTDSDVERFDEDPYVWLNGIEIWTSKGETDSEGNIVNLVSIDAGGYTTAKIKGRNDVAMSMLWEDLFDQSLILDGPQTPHDATRILALNMSFAIIPCDLMQTVNVADYIQILIESEYAEDEDALCMELSFEAFCAADGETPEAPSDLEEVKALTETLVEEGYPVYYSGAIQRRSELDSYLPDELLDVGELPAYFDALGENLENVVEQGTFVDPLLRYLNNRGEEQSCAPEGDTSCFYDACLGNSWEYCFTVASAGNQGEDYPFAPGLLNNVISAEADNGGSTAESCEFPFDFTNLLTSNKGAYIEDGILQLGLDDQVELLMQQGIQELTITNPLLDTSLVNPDYWNVDANCLAGSSFAAPRVLMTTVFGEIARHGVVPFDDVDGDGFVDDVSGSVPADACVSRGIFPDGVGCPDFDKDSVLDFYDQCGTEFGTAANAGCPTR